MSDLAQHKMSSTPESSPTRRIITRTDGRASRPRKRFEDEHYVHSISQAVSNLRLRRQSDPGACRISSLSPLRYRVKVDRDISEDSSEDESVKLHPRLAALKIDYETDPPEDYPLSSVGTRPKTPPNWSQWKRTQRSYSLPMGEPFVLEVGEALGAVAVSDPSTTQMELLKPPSPTGGAANRRRRSVSIEMTPMEAILEDSESCSAKNSRRYSTPVINAGEGTTLKQ